MVQRFLAALCCGAVLCGPVSADTDPTNPLAVAKEVLSAIVLRAPERLQPVSNDTNQRFIDAIVAGQRPADELYSGPRGEAATAWNGEILPPRFREGRNGRPEAVVPFAWETRDGVVLPLSEGPPEAEIVLAIGRYVALILTLDAPDDTTWGFEDINYVDPIVDYQLLAHQP